MRKAFVILFFLVILIKPSSAEDRNYSIKSVPVNVHSASESTQRASTIQAYYQSGSARNPLQVNINTPKFSPQSNLSSSYKPPQLQTPIMSSVPVYQEANPNIPAAANLNPLPSLSSDYKVPQFQPHIVNSLPDFQKMAPVLSTESLDQGKIHPETKIVDPQIVSELKPLTSTTKEP